MRHKIILILLLLVTLYAKAGEKNRIPNANVVSIFLTQLLPFELFSKKFCLNISELGLEIV